MKKLSLTTIKSKSIVVLNAKQEVVVKGGGSTRRTFDPIGEYNFFDD